MVINKTYPDLNVLLENSKQATAYYNNLPDYVKDAMQQRSSGVNSFDSLRSYADNLLAGDR